MSLHKLSYSAEGKSQVVSTAPAAGGVTVAADEIALWVGSLVGDVGLNLSVHNFVNDCLERLREIGTPTPPTDDYLTAGASWITHVPAKKDIVVATGVFGTPASNGVEIIIGDLFQPLLGSSVSTAVKRLLESYMELHGKKAA